MSYLPRLTLAMLGVAAAGAMPAQATILTRSFTVTASGFDVSPPVDPVTLSFTLTWDNSISQVNQTAGITLDSLNIPLGSALAFQYTTGADFLTVGGISAGVSAMTPGEDDLVFSIVNVSGPAPALTNALYILAPGFPFHQTFTGTVTVSDVAEPATATLFGVGLLGLRLVRRRRTG